MVPTKIFNLQNKTKKLESSNDALSTSIWLEFIHAKHELLPRLPMELRPINTIKT